MTDLLLRPTRLGGAGRFNIRLPLLTTGQRSWLRSSLFSFRPMRRDLFGALPAIALFFVPFVFWTGFTGSRSSVGGDAGFLFFTDPAAWERNSSSTFVSSGLGGFNAQTQFLPFLWCLRLVRVFDVNAQGLIFGVILAMAFLGTRALCRQLMGDQTAVTAGAGALAGLVYVSAPILTEIQWSSPLPRLLWIGLLPVLGAAIIRHQRTGDRRIPFAIGLLIAVLAPAVTDFPGTFPAVLMLIATLTFAWLSRACEFRVLRLLRMGITAVVINAFWLIPNALAFRLQGTQVSDAISGSGKQTAVGLVRALAPQQRGVDALELRQSRAMMIANNWVQMATDNWSRHLALLGLIPVFVIFIAIGLSRAFRVKLLVLSLVTAVFFSFQAVGVVPGSENTYVFLTNHVPGWTSVRNFYGTWPAAYVLALALTFGIACHAITAWWHKEARSTGQLFAVGCTVGALVVFYNAPFFVGQTFRLNYSGSITVPRALDGLSSDYRSAVSYLASAPAGDVVTLPLLSPAWTVVPSSGSRGYVGISPINYLTSKSDYDGLDSFGSGTSTLGAAVRQTIAEGNVAGLDALLMQLGVRYVLTDTALTANEEFGLGAAASAQQESAEIYAFIGAYASSTVARFGSWEVRTLDAVAPDAQAVSLVPASSLLGGSLADVANPPASATAPDNATGYGPEAHRASCPPVLARGAGLAHGESLTLKEAAQSCVLSLARPFSSQWQATVAMPGHSALTVPPTAYLGDLMIFELPDHLAGGTRISLTYRAGRLIPALAGLSGLAAVLEGGWLLYRRRRPLTSWDAR